MRFIQSPLFLLLLLVASSSARAQATTNPWQAPDLNPVTFHQTPHNAPVVLVDHGKPLAHLCIMGQVNGMALDELQKCIRLTTGVELPVLHDKIQDPALIIGAPFAALQDSPEALAIQTSPQQVRLCGNGPGLTWAIYEFLERYVGVRWYFPGDLGRSTIKLDTLVVPPVFLTDAPVFRKRELWPSVSHPHDGTGTDLRPLHQALRSYDSWPIKLHVHTPVWSHIEDYKKNRPEIFELTKDGKRDYAMLCYSNPETLTTYLENIQKYFAGDKSAVIGIEGDTITVSPNDDDVKCYCPDCRKLWDAKAGKYGTASRIVSTFVVKLATEVQKPGPAKRSSSFPTSTTPSLRTASSSPPTSTSSSAACPAWPCTRNPPSTPPKKPTSTNGSSSPAKKSRTGSTSAGPRIAPRPSSNTRTSWPGTTAKTAIRSSAPSSTAAPTTGRARASPSIAG